MSETQVRLLALRLANFRGARQATFEPAGDNARISGANGTGKTTIFDAWSWLLTGKDSLGHATFDIKTLKDGAAIPAIDHTVEGEIEIGGKTYTLRKTYREKWVKQRGETTATLTGHETDHQVDGVPVTAGEYGRRIAELLADEPTLRLLTDPLEFPERLHWQQRRQLLVNLVGELTDADVIATDAALAEVPGILGDRKIGEHRAMLRSRRAERQGELDGLPGRIDEVHRSLPDAGDAAKLRPALAKLEAERRELEEKRAGVAAGGHVSEATAALREAEAEVLRLRTESGTGLESRRKLARKEVAAAEDEVTDAERVISQKRREIEIRERRIEELDAHMRGLRTEFSAESERQPPEPESETTCPACGQELPADQVAAAREKATEEFRAAQAAKLRQINEDGKAAEAERAEAKELNARAEVEIGETEEALVKLREDLAEAETSLQALKEESEPESAELQAARYAVDAAKVKVEEARAGNAQALQRIDAEISALDEDLADARSRVARLDERERGERRIEELKDRERELNAQLEEDERQLYLLDLFERRMAAMLDERVGEHFKLARFRMFREHINGGLEPCCDVLGPGGVPFASGLNSGHRILVGLDIVETLQAHNGLRMPVWIDGAESLTEPFDLDTQVIKLAAVVGAPLTFEKE